MSARILVIDDDPGMRGLLLEVLSHAGHTIFIAADGREGTALLDRRSIDLIITDVLMPNQDGIETMSKIRRSHPTLPIIVMTGGNQLGSDYYLRIAKALGAARVLPKPFHLDDLLRHVKELLPLRAPPSLPPPA